MPTSSPISQEALAGASSAELALPQLPVQRLAVFRALQLGDMLCAVPALRALRAAFPRARITLAGLPWAEQFARRFHAYLDEFIAFPGHAAFPEQAVREERVAPFYQAMRASRFDLAVQMHGNGQVSNAIVREFGAARLAGFAPGVDDKYDSALFLPYPGHGAEPLRLLRLALRLGAPPSCSADLEFPITEQDRQELQDSGLAQGLVPGRYLCLHPGARIRNKCWPPQCFAEVGDALSREYRMPVVLTGAGNETDLTNAVAAHMRHSAINAAASISIGAMAALMSGARLLICNDTGVSHIAAGLKLPSVVIFSTADMQRWAPLDRRRHRCIRDPEGRHAADVLLHARSLLSS